METTFYFVRFYFSRSRELTLFKTRKAFCCSDDELLTLKAECRKYCRQVLRDNYARKAPDVTYCLSIISERQYNESTYSLI